MYVAGRVRQCHVLTHIARTLSRRPALQADFAELPCDVRQGGLRDAILHSAGANAAHGLRRTNADKRRAVLMLLEDEEWGTWNDSEIGRRCAVDHKTVARLRAEHLGISQDAPRTVERGSSVYEMKPRASAKPAEPEPSALAEAEPAKLPPALEAEPAFPLDAPPSNVVRAGDRFSLIPAPGSIELGGRPDPLNELVTVPAKRVPEFHGCLTMVAIA